MLRNLLHLGLGQVATTILTILLSATLARSLGAADFGVLYLLTTVATFAYVVVDWGHGALVVRDAAKYPERSGELLGSAIAVRAASSVVVGLLAVLVTGVLGYDGHTRLLAAVLIACWLPQYLGLSFGWVFRAHRRMDQEALLNVALKAGTLLGSIACLRLGGHLLELLGVWAVAGLLTLAMGILQYRRLRLPALSYSAATARWLLRDGAPLFVMALAIFVEPSINANILFKLASPEVVGWYGAAWTIAGTLVAPATILSATVYPMLSTAAGDPVAFRRAVEIALRPVFLLATLGAVGTWLFADVPVALVYGLPKFAASVDVLRAAAPLLLLIYVDMLLGVVILAEGRSARLAIFKVGSVALSAGLGLLLVPLCQRHFGNGGLGVIYAMAAGELIMLVAAIVLIRHVIDRRMLGDALRGLAAGAATIAVFRALPTFTPFLAIPACLALFAAAAFALGAVRRSDVERLLAARRGGAAAT